MKKITIIIPCFNMINYIENCIERLERQCDCNSEIVIIDDCSNDGTIEVCKKMAERYNNIKLIFHDKNYGVEKTRNDGIDIANGDWICFLDPDDSYADGGLKKSVDYAEKNKLDLVFTAFRIIQNGIEKEYYPKLKSGYYSAKEIATVMPGKIPWSIVSCIGLKLYRRDFINNNNIRFRRIYHYNEDGAFAVEAFMKAKTIGYIDECFYNYYQREGSSMHSYMKNAYASLIKVANLYSDYYESFSLRNTIYSVEICSKRVMTIWWVIFNELIYNKENAAYIIDVIYSDRENLHAIDYLLHYDNNIKNRLICLILKTENIFLLQIISWIFRLVKKV